MAVAKKNEVAEIQVMEVSRGSADVLILGSTPLICNRMSEKAKREFLLPAGRKNAAARASSLKHDPLKEYRDSPYRFAAPSVDLGTALAANPLGGSDPTLAPTLLGIPSVMFKGAMETAALDLAGVSRTQVGRLCYVDPTGEPGERGNMVALYGRPEMLMAITRSADMKRTPDVRTRVIIPEWCCRIRVSFIQPIMHLQPVLNLLAAAGLTAGIGDWRPEKGSGSYGQFEMVGAENETFARIVAEGGRQVQIEALERPQCYDTETSELWRWFQEEIDRRGVTGSTQEDDDEEEDDEDSPLVNGFAALVLA